MRDYLISQRKEQKALKKDKKSKGKAKHKDETPEERRARKAKKKEKKAKKTKSAGMKGVEDLLNSLGRPPPQHRSRSESRGDSSRHFSADHKRRSRSRSPGRRSRSPVRSYDNVRRHRPDPAYLDEDNRHSYGHRARGKSSRG